MNKLTNILKKNTWRLTSSIKYFIIIEALVMAICHLPNLSFSPIVMARWRNICSDEGRLFKGMYYLQRNKMKFQTFPGLYLSSSLILWENHLETPRTEEETPGSKMMLWMTEAETSKFISGNSILQGSRDGSDHLLPSTYLFHGKLDVRTEKRV